MLSLLLLAILTISCARENFDAVIVETPDLIEYAPEVQQRALDELQALGPPCLPMEVTEGCSALRTLVNDYGRVRDQIRAAQ